MAVLYLLLDLVLETPLRLKVDGRYLTPEGFRFGALFSSLLQRISLLTGFHTDTPWRPILPD